MTILVEASTLTSLGLIKVNAVRCALVVNYDLVSHKFAPSEFNENIFFVLAEHAVCFVHLLHIQVHVRLDFIMEASIMNPILGPLFAYWLPKKTLADKRSRRHRS